MGKTGRHHCNEMIKVNITSNRTHAILCFCNIPAKNADTEPNHTAVSHKSKCKDSLQNDWPIFSKFIKVMKTKTH